LLVVIEMFATIGSLTGHRSEVIGSLKGHGEQLATAAVGCSVLCNIE